MRKSIIGLLVGALLVLGFSMVSNATEIVWEEIGRGNLNLNTVLVSPENQSTIYIGTNSGVSKTEDGGEAWRNILSVKGQNREVNFLLIDLADKDSLYAATGNGLFYSNNQGKSWKRVFQGKNYLENECSALAILPDTIYLGTKAGLFLSKDKGRSWHRESTSLGKSSISAIAYDIKEPQYIYVACQEGVFKTKDKGQSWNRVFITHSAEKNNDNDIEEAEEKYEEQDISNIRHIIIDHNNLNYLYLATSRGVYKSQDRGETWELVSSYGLLSKDVRFILVSAKPRTSVQEGDKSNLYAATKSGVFEYRFGRWQELSLGLMAEDIRSLDVDSKDILYAACDKGLFKSKIEDPDNNYQRNEIWQYYKDEPSISEVQRVAIEYAEVGPEKITQWRRQAAKRAFLPKLSVELDCDKDRTISKSIWGTYGSNSAPGKYFIGPDDETSYNNKNFSISLTWDFGDLIWSDDQTSIDVRSRLMVQLRDDILDDINKVYFERLRVKTEIDNLSIEDRKKRFDKELRLQELTASLDALTGGFFSQQIKKQ